MNIEKSINFQNPYDFDKAMQELEKELEELEELREEEK